MYRPIAALLLSFSLCSVLRAQAPLPQTFHLVLPSGKGGILVDGQGGWELETFSAPSDRRAILQLNNKSQGLVVSYILDYDPQYNATGDMCRNDTLGAILNGPLKQARVTHKHGESRPLKNGQMLEIGSYLIEDNGRPLNQQNVFGFVAQDHVCAEIHLSRTPFHAGEEALFDPALNSFTFEPDYIPTEADYTRLASLAPPDMAARYKHQPSATNDLHVGPLPAAGPTQSITFALAEHPGLLHMDAPGFEIAELSAKPNGREFGIRARNMKVTHDEALGFLFLPEPAQPTAVACRDWMLQSEAKETPAPGQKPPYRHVLGQYTTKSRSGVEIAVAEYEQSSTPSPFRVVRRFFVAHGDLCADIELSGPELVSLDADHGLIDSLTFDPTRKPDYDAKFRYASVLYAHNAFAAAAPLFEQALAIAPTGPDYLTWRRVAADQSSMSYGLSGDIKRSREVNLAAIARDPDYPLYYYNLACADAEEGKPDAARIHLEQAFARKANTIPGETLPDPRKDDSILKLKMNKAFWAFVESLPAN